MTEKKIGKKATTTTRQVTLRVVCNLPEHISTLDLKDYLQKAVRNWGRSHHTSPSFSDKKLLNSMRILGKYKRKVS